MTRQLANARLLVVYGHCHTALLNPSTCAGNYMTAYFRTGALPPMGTVCRQDLPPFAPPLGETACAATGRALPRRPQASLPPGPLELRGNEPRRVDRSWLRAGLTSTGGAAQ
jgi:TAP-like protein